MRARTLGHLVVAAGLTVAAPPGARAQAPASSPLTLAGAVRLTLEQAPSIQSARAAVDRQAGVVRAERGPFDTVFRIGPALEHSATALRRAWQSAPFSDETANALSLSASLGHQLRGGASLLLVGRVDSNGRHYTDDRGTGDGAEVSDPSRFQSRVELQWAQPLSRGRGRVTRAAAERAAQRTLEAARESARQAAADRVLDVTVAYANLMAAQNVVTLRQQALAVERGLLDATARQVVAGDVPRADLTRAQARVAESEAAIAAARVDLTMAQAALAERIGLTARDAAVRAADPFPAAPPDVDPAAAGQASARRADLRAAGFSHEAARILADAAQADTRRRFDLSLNAGAATAYYSAAAGADFVRYYDPKGFGRSATDTWYPFVTVALAIELPWGNHAALGRLDRARANLTRVDVGRADLARVIATNVLEQAAAVRIARQEWQQRQETVTQQEASWAATELRRRAGDMSLIDTLLTEQDLTDARLALVQAQRDYLVAAARYRYETGTLIDGGR